MAGRVVPGPIRSAVMIRRLCRDYVFAIHYGSGGDLLRALPLALRVARARLKYRIGPFYFALLGLAQVPEPEWNNYIIMDRNFDERRSALSPGAIRGVVDDKILFHEHCLHAGLPTIPIICRVGAAALQRSSAIEHVDDAIRFAALMESSPPALIVKPVSGAHGEGIFRIIRHNGDFDVHGRKHSAADLFARLDHGRGVGAGFIIQPQMRPCAEMRCFASPNGLSTIRVITAMRADGPQVLFACLRIPVGTSVTDNFGTGTSGNLVAGIDVHSGILTCARGSSRRDWPVMVQHDAHPDTGCRIAGTRLPLWNEVVETALRGQQSLPDLKTIGWDIAATEDGIVLVELNSNYGVNTLQVAYQRGLKAELAAMLGITID